MRNGFVFLHSYYDSLKGLASTKRLRLYDAIMQYVFEGVEPELAQKELSALFTAMKPNIDSACRRYDANVQNGIKSGEARRKRREELIGCEPNGNEECASFEADKEKEKDKEKDLEKEAEEEKEVRRENRPDLTPQQLLAAEYERLREERLRQLIAGTI